MAKSTELDIIHVRVPPQLKEAVVRVAEQEDRSIQNTVRRLLSQALDARAAA